MINFFDAFFFENVFLTPINSENNDTTSVEPN